MAGMLPDGSNPEGVDPDPPLNWTKDTFSNNTKVKLYGMGGSPPTCKIITYLKYFKIEYEHVKKVKKGSSYKKMPIMDVGERQVNDSGVIVKFLVPALVGSEGFNQEWENLITFTVNPSVEYEVVSTRRDFSAWASGAGGFGMPWILAYSLGSVIGGAIKKGLKANPLNKIEDPKNALNKFMAEVGSNKFFGGAAPSQVDLSMYGLLSSFIVQQVPSMLALLDACRMWPWVINMDSHVPLREINPMAKVVDLKELCKGRPGYSAVERVDGL